MYKLKTDEYKAGKFKFTLNLNVLPAGKIKLAIKKDIYKNGISGIVISEFERQKSNIGTAYVLDDVIYLKLIAIPARSDKFYIEWRGQK
jgi:hypothetical protein